MPPSLPAPQLCHCCPKAQHNPTANTKHDTLQKPGAHNCFHYLNCFNYLNYISWVGAIEAPNILYIYIYFFFKDKSHGMDLHCFL